MKKLSQINESQNIPSNIKVEIIEELKNALKEEFNAWYGYMIVREWLVGICRPEIVKAYDELAEDELKDHAYWLMKRINELGGTIQDISNSPSLWGNANHPYVAPIWVNKTTNKDDIYIPIKESLIINIENEKGAIETYKHLIDITNNVDWTTNSKCKDILVDEEEHLNILQEFLDDINNMDIEK